MPLNLSKFEMAKGIILIEKLLVAGIFLALLISSSNIISPETAVYSVPQSIAGCIAIALASVWQIPLCLYLARKTGLFVPIILNTVPGILLPVSLGNGLRPSSPKKELRGSIRRFRTARRKPPSETNAKPRSSSAARSSSRNA